MTGLWHFSWFPMQSNAFTGRQICCVCVYIFVPVCMRLCACLCLPIWRSWCTVWQHVCRLFIGLSLLGLACMCVRQSYLTNPYINLIYYFQHFLNLPISYSPQIWVVPSSWMRSNKLAGTCLSCCRICSVRCMVRSPSHLSARNTDERIHPERNTWVNTTIAEWLSCQFEKQAFKCIHWLIYTF